MKTATPGIIHLIKDLAGGNVFTQRAPAGQASPFIIVQRTDREIWRSFNGPSGISQATIQIDAYADSYYKAQGLAGQIETILDGFMGLVTHEPVTLTDSLTQTDVYLSGISLQNDIDLIDETDEPILQRCSASYLVTYKQ